jgi:hypothetical protein
MVFRFGSTVVPAWGGLNLIGAVVATLGAGGLAMAVPRYWTALLSITLCWMLMAAVHSTRMAIERLKGERRPLQGAGSGLSVDWVVVVGTLPGAIVHLTYQDGSSFTPFAQAAAGHAMALSCWLSFAKAGCYLTGCCRASYVQGPIALHSRCPTLPVIVGRPPIEVAESLGWACMAGVGGWWLTHGGSPTKYLAAWCGAYGVARISAACLRDAIGASTRARMLLVGAVCFGLAWLAVSVNHGELAKGVGGLAVCAIFGALGAGLGAKQYRRGRWPRIDVEAFTRAGLEEVPRMNDGDSRVIREQGIKVVLSRRSGGAMTATVSTGNGQTVPLPLASLIVAGIRRHEYGWSRPSLWHRDRTGRWHAMWR